MANQNENGRNVARPDDDRPSVRTQDQSHRSRGDDGRDDHRSARDRSRLGGGGSAGRDRDDGRNDSDQMTERHGQGQSGAGSGRYGDDRSLGFQNRNQYGTRGRPDEGVSSDDRFTGRGGPSSQYWEDRGDRQHSHDADRMSGNGGEQHGPQHGGYNSGYNQGSMGYGGYGGQQQGTQQHVGSQQSYRGGQGGAQSGDQGGGHGQGGHSGYFGQGHQGQFDRGNLGPLGEGSSQQRYPQGMGGPGVAGPGTGSGQPGWGPQGPYGQGGPGGQVGPGGPGSHANYDGSGGRGMYGQGSPSQYRGEGPQGGHHPGPSERTGEKLGIHRGKGPQGYMRSDERIREQVCEALADDHHVDASSIEVVVKNGDVILTGTVDDRQQKRQAEDVVERCAGVKDVQNQLRVSSADPSRVRDPGTSSAVGKNETEMTSSAIDKPTGASPSSSTSGTSGTSKNRA